MWLFVADLPGGARDDGAADRPTVIANPPGDAAFRAQVDGYLNEGGRRPEDLQTALRRNYPNAVVRLRSLAGERFEVWYVYRDGHWIGAEKE